MLMSQACFEMSFDKCQLKSKKTKRGGDNGRERFCFTTDATRDTAVHPDARLVDVEQKTHHIIQMIYPFGFA